MYRPKFINQTILKGIHRCFKDSIYIYIYIQNLAKNRINLTLFDQGQFIVLMKCQVCLIDEMTKVKTIDQVREKSH